MTAAIANAPLAGIPGKRIALWKPSGAVIAVLVTALAVMALTERGEARACDGAPLTVAEVSLPALTDSV